MKKKMIRINEDHVAEEPIPEDDRSCVPATKFVKYRDTTTEALEALLGIGAPSDAASDQGMPGPSAEGGEAEPEIITAARTLRSKLVKEGIL